MAVPGTAAPPLRRERILLSAIATIYACGLITLFALGYFGFVWKTLVVPSLFIVAWLAGRFRGFVRDWSMFLGAIVLFDSCRGLIYAAIQRLDLPAYMSYAIDAERALFGGVIPSIALQQVLFADGQVGVFERVLVGVHASHFVVFLGFGLAVWLLRARGFPRMALGFVLLTALGLVGYLAVPTVPPWMAAERFQVLSGLERISSEIYNISLPTLAKSFDLNPVAAMPSLHAAFPALLTLICFREFGRWGFAMLAYFLTVLFAIVYLGEHYVVDALAGIALAAFAYFLVYRWSGLKQVMDWAGQMAAGPAGPGSLYLPVAVTAGLLALSVFLGFASRGTSWRFIPNEAFIAEELEGRTPVASYYRALNAQRLGDYRRTQTLVAAAIPGIVDSALQLHALAVLAESAYHNGDFATAAAAFARQPKLSRRQAGMLAQARAAIATATPPDTR